MGHFDVIVVDATSGQPITGAKVTAKTIKNTNGCSLGFWDKGCACFGTITPGDYTVIVEKTGYNTVTTSAYVSDTPSYIVVNLSPSVFTLTISATQGGTTDPAPGTYSFPAMQVVNVTAIASEGYVFEKWVFNGKYGDSRVTVPVTMYDNIDAVAYFVTAPPTLAQDYTLVAVAVASLLILVIGGVAYYYFVS